MSKRTITSASTAAAAFTAAALLLGLTACANIDNLLHQRHEESFETYETAASGWVGVELPEWVPTDSTELRSVASNDQTVSVIRVVSDSELAGDCARADRHGIPVFDVPWSTDDWADTLFRCGEYEVQATDDGWLGWFNAAEPGDVPDGK